MPRRHVVRDLNDEQFTFVIEAIVDGFTDREISVKFTEAFDQPLAKSSLNRWRKAAGDELAERYRIVRYQAKKLLEDINESEEDKFKVVMNNLEDGLLTSMRELISRDPVKLFRLRLDEEKRRLKEREINLKEKQIDLEISKLKTNQIDPEKFPSEIIEYLLDYIGSKADGLQWFKANAKKFEAFLVNKLKEKYAQA